MIRAISMVRSSAVGAVLAACFAIVPAAQAQMLGDRTVRAEGCSAAVGGSINHSAVTIICGLSPEVIREIIRPYQELNDDKKFIIDSLREKLQLTNDQIRSALRNIYESEIDDKDLTKKLLEVILDYKKLLETSFIIAGDSPSVVDLKTKVRQALDKGDLEQAKALLNKVDHLNSNVIISFEKIAGIGGLALVVLLSVFKGLLAKNIFPMLGETHAYRLLRLVVLCMAAVALAGLAAWVYGTQSVSTKVEAKKGSGERLANRSPGLL